MDFEIVSNRLHKLAGGPSRTDASYILIRKFYATVRLSKFPKRWMSRTSYKPCPCPALSRAVGVVLSNGSKKEMIGPDAGRVVAPMTDSQTGWNGSAGKCVSYAVRLLTAVDAVALIATTSLPLPAAIGLQHETMEGATHARHQLPAIKQTAPLARGGRVSRRERSRAGWAAASGLGTGVAPVAGRKSDTPGQGPSTIFDRKSDRPRKCLPQAEILLTHARKQYAMEGVL